MAPHVSHTGVHDHGFNNVSTYGNLLRLMNEGAIAENAGERNFYELALKISGAVQAARWTKTADGGGYIYSFNGPHSLFVDTIRSLRALAVSHKLGHVLMGENDRGSRLLERLVGARGRRRHDIRFIMARAETITTCGGERRTRSVFNVNDGNYRCPNSQQGYSPFSTWTRGSGVGYVRIRRAARVLEPLRMRTRVQRSGCAAIHGKAAEATCDFYIDNSPV